MSTSLKLAQLLDDQGNLNTDGGSITGGAGSFTTGDFSGDVSLVDNAKVIFGNGSDLQIYHDGSNSIIEDVGTGALFISGGSSVGILNNDRSEYLINANQNSSVDLYYNGAKKLETTNTGVAVAGNTIIGSSSVSPDGTLHVHSGSAGTVTANASADDLVVENSADSGISILTSDAFSGRFFMGTPALPVGARVEWSYNNARLNLGTNLSGAITQLRSDANITNLTLSGGSGSELASFTRNVNVGGDITGSNSQIRFNSAQFTGSGASLLIGNGTTLANSTAAEIALSNYGTTGAVSVGAARIRAIGGVSNWFSETSLSFQTNPGPDVTSTTAVERLRLRGQVEAIFNDSGDDYNVRMESTGNSAMFFMDAGNDKVGIGTSVPDGRLHVHSGSAGSVTANAIADELVIEHSTTGGASILVPDGSTSSFFFGSPSDTAGAKLQWNYNAGSFEVGSDKVGASLVLEADSSVSNLTLSGGSGNQLAEFAGDVEIDGDLSVLSATPKIVLEETDAGTDEKNWRQLAFNGALVFQSRNEANNAGKEWLAVNRTGTAIDSITYGNAADLPAHNFEGSIYANGYVTSARVIPALYTDETGATTDERLWRFAAANGDLYGQTRTDADGLGKQWLRVNRAGVDVTSITYGNNTDNPDHLFYGPISMDGGSNYQIDGDGNIRSSGSFFGVGPVDLLTLASGTVTATGSNLRIDTEGAASTDDCDTINIGDAVDGDIIVVRQAINSRDVTFKDNTGNLKLAGDFVSDNYRDKLVLQYDDGIDAWIELSRSNNA